MNVRFKACQNFSQAAYTDALPSVGKRIGFGYEPNNSAVTLQITVSQELVNGAIPENYCLIGELPDKRSRRLLSG